MPGVVGKYDPHGAKSRPEKKGTAEVMRPFFCAGGGNIHFIGTLTQGNQILNFMAPLALVDKADQVLNSLFATFIGVHHPSYRIGKCKQNAVVPEFRLRTIGIIKITVDKHREHRDAIGRAYLLMVNGKALNGKGRRFIEQYRCDLGISPVYDAACYYQALNEYKSFHCISISLIRSQLHTAATVSLIGRIFASRLRCHLSVASLRRGYGVATLHLRPLTQNAPYTQHSIFDIRNSFLQSFTSTFGTISVGWASISFCISFLSRTFVLIAES